RDAVDSHRVWELDPEQIIDERPADRLDVRDVQDLRLSIETNGQTVPILVRRDPEHPDRYRLVYGARRLEAIRGSDKVDKVRALIAALDDDAAVRAQVLENTARRDLSFIERALFAMTLLDNGFGTQVQIAEVLNATRSAVSMAISVARAIGVELADAIGPAHGVGRPRWEALAQAIAETGANPEDLRRIAHDARVAAQFAPEDSAPDDPSVAAFEAVTDHLRRAAPPAPRRPSVPARKPAPRALTIDGETVGKLRRTDSGLRLDLTPADPGFADWFESQAEPVLKDLFERWQQHSKAHPDRNSKEARQT
ncbi:MAG: plasmid partitioning protein RepB, partial [Rhodobacteraceae bacterium]|nr:plasmid partitioning protein RepB [Paracoccaceae bacterium]